MVVVSHGSPRVARSCPTPPPTLLAVALEVRAGRDEATPRFLTAEVVAAAQAFGADAGRVDVEVNTLDDAVLVDYTERGWSAY